MMRVRGVERGVSRAGRPTSLFHIEMSQRYRHTAGSADPFYRGIDQGVLRATRCDGCGASWFPPRPFCPVDLAETAWYDLPGTGTVTAATRVHIPPPFGGVETPYLLASIRLDGVEGGITHRVLGDRIPEKGTVVAVKFMEGEPAHPLLRAAFEIERRTA